MRGRKFHSEDGIYGGEITHRFLGKISGDLASTYRKASSLGGEKILAERRLGKRLKLQSRGVVWFSLTVVERRAFFLYSTMRSWDGEITILSSTHPFLSEKEKLLLKISIVDRKNSPSLAQKKLANAPRRRANIIYTRGFTFCLGD